MKKISSTTLILCLALVFSFAQNHNSSQAYLGVHTNFISKKKAEKLNFETPNGSYVTNVVNNTAAEKNGLQPFDYIYQIGAYQLEPHQSIRSVLKNFQPGDEAMVYFVRNGKAQSKMITLGNKSDANPQDRSREEDPFLGVQQNHDKVPENVVGVPVDIVKNSTAEKMGLEENDIIMEINDFPIYDWHDMGTAVDMMEVGDEMKVKYMRGNKITVAYAPVQSMAASKKSYNHGSYSYSYSWNSGHNNDDNKETGNTNENDIAEAVVEEVATPMDDMVIDMDDMPLEEAEEMKENLGIDMPVVQNLEIEQLNIFPNPSEGVFNLRFTLPNNGQTAIRIFNSNGKMIYSNDLGNFQGDFNERLDLSSNPAGTYYLMVQQGKFSISKKVNIIRA